MKEKCKKNKKRMTETEFIEKAKRFGYTDEWIQIAIGKMNEFNAKYDVGYTYEDYH